MILSHKSLCSYYLDCLSKEIKDGIWRYTANAAGDLNYVQLLSLPHHAGDTDIYSNSTNIINKVRNDNHGLILQLGYPTVISKHNWQAYKLEPILLFQYNTDSFITGGTPKLLDEPPAFNFEVIRKLSGLPDTELLNEVIAISEELGLDESFTLQANFDTILIKLQAIRPYWNWRENIDPIEVTNSTLGTITQEGIYNAPVLYATEASRYTKGLEKELNNLKNLEPANLKYSALYNWITGDFASAPKPNRSFEELLGEEIPQSLLQPIPLNDEQKHAVQHALGSPLTVIKGPPGTGKSQVVSSIIINAIYQGQTVLFTSKNNKAVDVVFNRVEGLSSSPAMLRLGKGDTLHNGLINTLTNILAATVTDTDRNEFKHYTRVHEEHSRKQSSLENNQVNFLTILNRLNGIENAIQPFRERIGEELFLQISQWSQSQFQEIENLIKEFTVALEKADGDKQGLFVQLFWFIYKRARFKAVDSAINSLKEILPILSVQPLSKPLSTDSFSLYVDFNYELKSSLSFAKKIQEYFGLLSKLKNHKSLFHLAQELQTLEEDFKENSSKLWNSWLRLLPERINDKRAILSDYLALLKLVAGVDPIPKHIWAKFFALQEQMTHILSCWSVTSLSAKGRIPFKPGFFDLVIIDEASQCDIASALPLLLRAKRAVIIGDNKQLTHITAISKNQDKLLLEKHSLFNHDKWSYREHSLFELALGLCSTEDVIMLNDHHRSHADIIEYSNKEFYNNELRVATRYGNIKPIKNEPTVRWHDVVGRVIRPHRGGSYNQIEARAVYEEVKRLIDNGYPGTIGVVTPFKEQKNRINDLIKQDIPLLGHLATRDFLCDTVHKFQGDERDVIIFSPVISHGMSDGSLNFLKNNGNLFNVAITRARAAIIIVGDKSSCSISPVSYMKSFVEYVSRLDTTPIDKTVVNKDYGAKYPKFPSRFKISQWEKKLYEGLYRKGIKTVPQLQVDQYILDLALFINGKKLNIEVDGEAYHRSWDGELVKRDQIRNKRLIENGWDVKRFWVYEVRDDFDGCISRVRKWIENTQAELYN